MIISKAAIAASLLTLWAQTASAEVDASAIFEALEPSIVSISDAEGGASGVVLSESGLILTNFHVASSPLPMRVEAIVTEGGKTVKKVFEGVKLSKVHRSSDLALLQIDAKGARFKVAKISKSERDTLPGGACFALGYPYVPGQDKAVLAITKGIVSSAKRMVEGEPYIQVDAAINPGNSGGALVNEKGVVIGIPTLKYEGADRIALAAPLADLSMDQFVDIAQRKGNPEAAARLSAIAMTLMMRDTLSFGLDSEAVQVAASLQREAISLDPNNAEWLMNMSDMYWRLEKMPIALAYATSAVEKDSANLHARVLLADCYDELGKPEEALVHRFACLGLPVVAKDTEAREQVMVKLTSGYSAKNDLARALYVVSWLQSLGGKPLGATERLVLQNAGDALPAALVEEIMAKKDGHSASDMEAFAKRAPAAQATSERPAVAPADPTALKPQAARSDKIVSQLRLAPGSKAEMVDSPPGVEYDKATGSLVWMRRPFAKAATADVLFLVTRPDGTEEILVHKIEP